MKARLYSVTGQMAGIQFEFNDRATIGKSKSNSLVLESPLISSRHARISYDPASGSFMLEDTGSRNGTRLDGVRVRQKEKLGSLQIITFAGRFDFVFQVAPQETSARPDAEISMPEVDHTRVPNNRNGNANGDDASIQLSGTRNSRRFVVTDKRLAKTVMENSQEAQRHDSLIAPQASLMATQIEAMLGRQQTFEAAIAFHLEIEQPSGQKRSFKLAEKANLIGRVPECDICIEDPSISRRHAVLKLEQASVTITDLGSRNHTFVNDTIISSEVGINSLSALRFGAVAAKIIRKGTDDRR